MRKAILIAGLVLGLGILVPASAPAAQYGSDLPFQGSFSGTSEHNLATGHVDAVWMGDFTHFGLAMLEMHGQVDLPTLTLSGSWTLTAANGDQMLGTAVGALTPTDPTHITLVIDFTSTPGGTGRFAGASATFTATIYHTRVAFDPPISYGEQEGTLDGQLSW